MFYLILIYEEHITNTLQKYEKVRLPFVNEFNVMNTNARREDMIIIDRLYDFQEGGDEKVLKMNVRIPTLPSAIFYKESSSSSITTTTTSSSSSSATCPGIKPRNSLLELGRDAYSSSVFESPDDDVDTQVKTTLFHEKTSFLSISVLDLWEPSILVLLKILVRQPSQSENNNNNVNNSDMNEFDAFNDTVISLDPFAFVRRVLRYNIMQPENFVVAAVLIERIRQRNRITITRQNIESLFVFACVVSTKCNDDFLMNNKTYSLCLCVPLPVFNILELKFLHLIEFDSFVSPSDYYSHECCFLPAIVSVIQFPHK